MTSDYFAIGLNHESAPVSVIEPFEFASHEVNSLLDEMKRQVTCEWMYLATCNRTEIYGYGPLEDAQMLKAGVADLAGVAWPEASSFSLHGQEAVSHIIEVTAGLKSQVLGDVQILNQVKSAYRQAHKAGTVSTYLHKLLHVALATGKKVASETDLSRGNPSVASLATRVARRLLHKYLRDSGREAGSAFVIGAGEMGGQIAKILSHDRSLETWICSRSRKRADKQATRLDLAVVPWEERIDKLADVDVVFVATSSKSFVLAGHQLPARNGTPLLVVDISVPRNVDPAAADRPDYRVLDLDALKAIEASELRAQDDAVSIARSICRESTSLIDEWGQEQQLLRPAIQVLAEAFETIRRQELDRNLHRIDDQYHEEVDLLTRSIMKKLLAIPVVRLKTSAGKSDRVRQQAACIAELFRRDACEEQSP